MVINKVVGQTLSEHVTRATSLVESHAQEAVKAKTRKYGEGERS